jgi:membrane-associated phospholipid phosphatase
MKKKSKLILGFSLAFLVLSLVIEYISDVNIYNAYPNLQVATDFLFLHLPFINILWLADLLLLLASTSFLFFMFSKKEVKNFPFYATVIGIFNLIRAGFIYLTPLGNPHPASGLGLAFLPSGGMFPSGHVGAMFLFFLFALKSKSKYWSIYFMILLVIEVISMILSRGHYTIDMIGALFIAFTIWKVVDEHFKKKLVLR